LVADAKTQQKFGIKGQVLRRGDAGYEEARKKAVWHAGTPARFPEVIVRARDESDVAGAVRLARAEGRKLAVRSGGHSWSGSHLRDGIVLIDLSQLKDVSINAKDMTATAQPGLQGAEVDDALAKHDRFFPIGHCKGVCIGGYLLQGGFAWRGREFGPSCMSITGIDVVTADGEMIHADETHNPDLFWAARGAGPGFFAVVTRFYLKLYPRHKVTLKNIYVYPPDVWEPIYRWSRSIEPKLPAEVEINTLMYRDEAVTKDGPVVSVLATAYANAEQHARDVLSVFETCPVRDRALVAEIGATTTLSELSSYGTAAHYPADKRFIADNMWTHASFDELEPGLRAIQAGLPPAPSHMVWFPWTLTPERPPMAYSVEDELYIALYGAWSDPADDEKYKSFVTERLRAMEPVSTGIQLADENLINRPRHFLTDANFRRLDKICAAYDPDGLFVSWLGRPTVAGSPGS
jgi:FAD/FMN-containing dehydrogenase